MGIKGLNTFIKKYCPECMFEKNISDYNGSTFAIDASILLYKYVHISNVNPNCKDTHILGFINRIKMYKDNNITPIFVFDGAPPEEKRETLKKRHLNKKKITDKIDALSDLSSKIDSEDKKEVLLKEIKRLNNQLVYVTKEHIEDCKKIIKLLGVQYFVAPDEAEKYCVYLYKNNIANYIVSDDTDVFTFGGYNVIKSTIKNKLIEYNFDTFLEKINYSKSKFIDFCILAGCDYLPYVPNLAINTVFTLFKKYNTIEEIINLKKYNFPENYNYDSARSIFVNYNYDEINIDKTLAINYKELEEFLNLKEIKNIQKIIKKF